MGYKRLSKYERLSIYRWRQEGHGFREIARRLRRAGSSVCRELIRNRGKKAYRPKQADWKARVKAKRDGSRRFTEAVRLDVEKRLREDGWSPEIISQRARLEKRASVCKETIYQHVYADAKAGGTLWQNLARARRKRRRRCPRQEGRGRGRIPNQRMIETRPAEVATRETVGHWEGDLMNGARETGHLVTLVERKTRYTLVGRTWSKEAEEVTEEICRQFGRMPEAVRLSLTLDNGKEFARHETMALGTKMAIYFARPYHSWERGTNENTNGLIRRLYPKQSCFDGIDQEQLDRIERYLNDRPRKCLGWRTPREMMRAFLASAS